MKSIIALSLLGLATAFPHIQEQVNADRARRQLSGTGPQTPVVGSYPRDGGVPRTHTLFDENLQLVSTSGQYAFVAPVAGDQRGPCPGLNAAANHGYLPHNGVATPETVTIGLNLAYGLSRDATSFLTRTTAFFDGDNINGWWSIGAFDNRTYSLGGALEFAGVESGICKLGHLKSEGDASITRGDYLAPSDNDNCASYPKFFKQLLDLACEMNTGVVNKCEISMDVLARHQNERKLYSIATNPNYFSPVFAGVAFTPAAHSFVAALMSNHSAERPEGFLTPDNLMQFFSYTYDINGALVFTPGHERIPDDWYKRHPTDEWTMADIGAEIAQQCQFYPQTCAVGGNQGAVNTFAGIDVGDVSGGLYNATALTDPALFGCFLSQNIQAEAIDQINYLFQGPSIQTALDLLPTTLFPGLAAAFGSCNGLNAPNGPPSSMPKGKPMSAYASKFPGAGYYKYAKAHPEKA